VGIADQHVHPERNAERSEILADHAVADDPQGRAAQLAPDPRVGRAALAIDQHGTGNIAREIDHAADRHLGDRGGKARRRVRHQHADSARRRHVDVADIDRAAQESDEIGCVAEERGGSGRLAVGHDDFAAARGLRQRIGIEHPAGVVDAHVAELAQGGDGALAVIIAQHVGHVGEEDARHALRPHRGNLTLGKKF
jgi:hypothetical protein